MYKVHTEFMYRIHVAAKSAGVSPQLLRAWERRYGLLSPKRTGSGYRVYSDDDVAVLRGAKALVEQGRSISDVARLPREELRMAAGSAPVSASLAPPAAMESFRDAALVAIATFDSAQLESLILHATGMGALSSVEMCDRVLMPLLAEIGDRWEKGELDIAAEHFGSSIVRRHLHVLVQDESRRHAGAPAIVCACLEGDMHEGGLLGFALHAAVLGWAIVYLGANTPIEETISAAGRGTVAGIGLSVTREMKRQERRDLVERLAAWRNKRPGRVVWLGGSAARAHAQEFSAAGLEVLQDGRDLARGRPKA